MSWRTVVITDHCKLDYRLGYLVIRTLETRKILLDEISILIIENPAISMTGCLIAEMNMRKIKVIFCDEKRNPSCELVGYYGCHDCSARIKEQIKWSHEKKGFVWTSIVSEKIKKQAAFLAELNKCEEAELLQQYVRDIAFCDETNREGHAAKVYFNALFGMDFIRSDDNIINAALNYGYSIILSAINREIVSCGYLTQLGIFHDNMFNQFNLSCDLMEPFRILVDRFVYHAEFDKFETEEKHSIADVLNETVIVDGQKHYVISALGIYSRSVFDALSDGDVSLIKFYNCNEL